MNDPPGFIFTVCQVGAEDALKNEIARHRPAFRFAYSRPGFVTFKLPSDVKLPADFDLRSTFARTYGFSLGKATGTQTAELARELWNLVGDRTFQHLHVWQRDLTLPGERGFEPGVTPLANEVAAEIAQRRVSQEPPLRVNEVARSEQDVLDCVLVEPGEWWIGFHRTSSTASRWPGGVIAVEEPEAMISRAYLKLNEALTWSRLPIAEGDLCAEIGSAPGGSCQALLERGLQVIGIDPAEMEPSLVEHSHFIHYRCRAAEVRRRDFRGVKWLLADSNVAPGHTLDSVEAIVTHPSVQVRGMLLTLKLLSPELVEQLPECLDRIRGWGFEYVKARQLAYNRREVCAMALRRRSMRREPPWKRSHP